MIYITNTFAIDRDSSKMCALVVVVVVVVVVILDLNFIQIEMLLKAAAKITIFHLSKGKLCQDLKWLNVFHKRN